MSSLEAVVRELRWSDARTSAMRFAVHALVAGTGWIFAVLLASRALPVAQTLRIAAAGVPVAIVALAVAWVAARPSPASLMRTADLRLFLKERLSTAWERRTSDGPMDGALRQDALDQAARVKLSLAFPVGLRPRELLLAAALALAAAVLLVLPNPMDQVLAQRNADRAAQAKAANTITVTQKKLAAAPATGPVDAQVQKILNDTRARIASAPDPRSALQNITPAEQQLLQLSDPGTPARVTTAQNLANSLAQTSAGQAAGQALSASPSQGALSLRQLASSLQNLSAQDRAALAKALAQAATHAKDPQMQASMQRAAAALQSGDVSAAAGALDDVAGQLDSLQQQETNDQEIASAINGLEAARQQLAGQADRDSGSSTSQAGAAAAAGAAGASPSAGAGGAGSGNSNGTGGGSNPGGTGSGNGSGNGGGGSGGTGGTGSSGSGAGSGAGAQSTERVYVPAAPVPGQTQNEPTPLGPGQDVPLTPYMQVIQAYQQVALNATNQSLIPGSEQDLIRQYFSSLGETGP